MRFAHIPDDRIEIDSEIGKEFLFDCDNKPIKLFVHPRASVIYPSPKMIKQIIEAIK